MLTRWFLFGGLVLPTIYFPLGWVEGSLLFSLAPSPQGQIISQDEFVSPNLHQRTFQALIPIESLFTLQQLGRAHELYRVNRPGKNHFSIGLQRQKLNFGFVIFLSTANQQGNYRTNKKIIASADVFFPCRFVFFGIPVRVGISIFLPIFCISLSGFYW